VAAQQRLNRANTAREKAEYDAKAREREKREAEGRARRQQPGRLVTGELTREQIMKAVGTVD
jgi:hypothetical protein